LLQPRKESTVHAPSKKRNRGKRRAIDPLQKPKREVRPRGLQFKEARLKRSKRSSNKERGGESAQEMKKKESSPIRRLSLKRTAWE